MSLRYVDSVEKLHHPDMILLPGSKNTMEDLKWMRQNGLEAAILHRSAETFILESAAATRCSENRLRTRTAWRRAV